ncbi:hypothetical protein ANCCEY_09940 [Ancylostoma ceylanicum]|nr:hypothetical protein ANCCEY_09940 [Ancylostoma ceylanicum]EYC00712.1 hypothetical protein Y032_0113g363 [Ancylostoma ceylanicum]
MPRALPALPPAPPLSPDCLYEFCTQMRYIVGDPSRFTNDMETNIKNTVAQFETAMLPSYEQYHNCTATLTAAGMELPVICRLIISNFFEAYEKMASNILKQLQPIDFDATSRQKMTTQVHVLTQCVILHLQKYSKITFLSKL